MSGGEGGMGGGVLPGNSQCGLGEVCTFLQDHIDGLAAANCQEAEPAGPRGAMETCRPAATNYWGNCDSDFLCSSLSEGDPPQCLPLCDRRNLDACGERQACVEAFRNVAGAGICLGECDVFQNTGCGPDQQCALGNVGATAERPDQVIGFCQDNPNPGNQQTGEMCVRDADTGVNNCAPGHLCQDFGNDIDECIKLCQEDAEGGECPDGYECRTGVFRGLDTVGICAR